MMTIKFKTDNAAFRDEVGDSLHDYYKSHECIRILQRIIECLQLGDTSGSCIDINGNKVGEWTLK